MKRIMRAAFLATALCSGAHTALADEAISEQRAVDARTVNVNLDGVISLNVKQGPAALTIYGDPRYLPKVVVEQHGDSLHIGTDLRGVHMGKMDLRAELTLPNLHELVSAGVGSTKINGFNGDTLNLALNGAGGINARAQYRNVTVKLGGAGSINLDAGSSDNMDVNLRGAGSMHVHGQSKKLHANLSGVGSLDARQLQADSIDVSLTGLGSARVYAKNSANMNLTGLGSATVYGNPANRQASARGMGSVHWE